MVTLSVVEGTTLKVLETDESYSGKISNKDYIAGKTLVLPEARSI